MSYFDPQQRNMSKVKKVVNRFFPERQIIIRTGESLKTLQIGSYFQVVAAALILSACIFVGSSSILQVHHTVVVAQKEAQVEQSKAAYDALMGQVSLYRDKISGVVQELDRAHVHTGETDPGAASEGNDAEVSPEGNSPPTGRVISSGQSAGGELSGSGETEKLQEQIAALQELEELHQQLALLEGNLEETSAQGESKRIDALDLELRKVILQRDVAQVERSLFQQKISALEAQVTEMEDTQIALAHKFSMIADDRIEEIRSAIRKTGLDPDAILRSKDFSEGGQGGPFIPLDEFSLQSSDMRKTLASLNGSFETLSALQSLVGALPLGKPLRNWRVTSGFGVRSDPFNGEAAIHEGIDMSTELKDPVFSPAPGKVVYAGWRGRYGRLIEIDHGNGIKTRYAHLNNIFVKRGDWVGNYSKIGLVGTSGRSTGPHLHYEVRVNGVPRNPEKFIMAGTNVYKN